MDRRLICGSRTDTVHVPDKARFIAVDDHLVHERIRRIERVEQAGEQRALAGRDAATFACTDGGEKLCTSRAANGCEPGESSMLA